MRPDTPSSSASGSPRRPRSSSVSASLAVQWVPVTVESRFRALQKGEVDLLCGAETATLGADGPRSPSRFRRSRAESAALVRADAPARLREVLSRRPPEFAPVLARAPSARSCRRRPSRSSRARRARAWLASRAKDFQIAAQVAPVESYEAGVRRRARPQAPTCFFGDRAILLDAATRSPSAGRPASSSIDLFTFEPLALALQARRRGLPPRRGSRAQPALRVGGDRRPVREVVRQSPTRACSTFFRSNALPD